MKTLEGVVTSLKMKNTVVVEVFRRTPHPLYKKIITRSNKLKADSNGMVVSLGDIIKISEVKPISKEKNFIVSEIVRKKEKNV